MRRALLGGALLLACALMARDEDAVKISERREGGNFILSARNTDMRLKRWLQLSLEQMDNVAADRPYPVQAVLLPGETRELLRISQRDPSRGAAYRTSSIQGFGDPEARPDASQLWLVPYEHGTKHAVGQGYFGSSTHQGIQALDFDMPEGTTICASRDGIVAGLKDDSDMGGQSPAYARLGNYIEILHDDGTWSTYAHLKRGGALLREGDRVRAGDPIALSGQTGQASGPHLHFSAQMARWNGPPETIPTCFALGEGKNGFLQEGDYVYAWHPGKPAFERKDASTVDEAALERQIKPATGGKIRFREERIDNKILVYCVNPTPKRLEVTVSFASSKNAIPSKPLPLARIVPAQSEAFLLSILMKGGSSYETRFSYRPLP